MVDDERGPERRLGGRQRGSNRRRGDERRKEADSNEDADGTPRAEDGARERSLESDGITRRPTVVASTVALAAVALALVIVASASLTGAGRPRRWPRARLGLIGPVPGADGGSSTPDRSPRSPASSSRDSRALVEPTLVATVCTVVAWDLAGSAIDLGDQLGREADTRRLEGSRGLERSGRAGNDGDRLQDVRVGGRRSARRRGGVAVARGYTCNDRAGDPSKLAWVIGSCLAGSGRRKYRVRGGRSRPTSQIRPASRDTRR